MIFEKGGVFDEKTVCIAFGVAFALFLRRW